jgi:thymidylate kinase
VTQTQSVSRLEDGPTVPVLGVLRTLFDRLHAEGIRYCHWKSNEHLDPSLVGKTDVDVLVERRAIVSLTRILGETNFKRFVVKAGRGYPGIEDYVGFDPDTGVLTHLHVHYQLTLGEKFLKGHRLPWEELYLSTRVLHQDRCIYIVDPHLELVVLVIRAAMKLRARDFLIQGVGKPYFRGGLLREFRWLAARVRPERVAELATSLVGPRLGGLFPAIIAAGQPSLAQLLAMRRAEPRLQEYRLYGRWESLRHAWARELGIIWWKAKNWYLGAPTKSTRTLPQGGLTVAFVGADGAGKSTMVAEIAEWLSHEVAVVCTYGGSGKGSAGRPRRLLQGAAALRRRILGRTVQPERPRSLPDAAASPVSPKPVSLGRAVWVRALANERRKRAWDTRRARSLGMVVLSDRFPQSQFPGWNDGPRLNGSMDHSWWHRAAARRERQAFQLAELCPPDLVIKLHVSPEVAASRKPETPRQQILTGVEMVRRLSYPATTRIVDIDGSQPLQQVILQVKRALWNAI